VSRLTPDQLARQAGTSAAQVERFVELGILEHREGGAPFDVRDIHRVRFAEAIDAAGISLVDLARLVEAGKYSFSFIEGVFPESGRPLLETTFGELARQLELPWEGVEEMYAN
jgi:hypothetical protein